MYLLVPNVTSHATRLLWSKSHIFLLPRELNAQSKTCIGCNWWILIKKTYFHKSSWIHIFTLVLSQRCCWYLFLFYFLAIFKTSFIFKQPSRVIFFSPSRSIFVVTILKCSTKVCWGFNLQINLCFNQSFMSWDIYDLCYQQFFFYKRAINNFMTK